MKNKAITLLDDPTFQYSPASPTDIPHHLNELNVKLQGRNQIITQMYDHVKSFKVKLGLWIKQLHKGNLIHFSTLKSLGKVEPKCLKEYADLWSTLIQQFDIGYAEFEVLQLQFQLFSTPFAVQVDNVAEELQMELAEPQLDSILKQKHADIGIPKFYLFLSRERFPRLLSATARIIAMFGSTYVCKQFFSSVKANKSVIRSRLTDEYLQATLRVATSNEFKLNIGHLADAKRCQLSSQNKI